MKIIKPIKIGDSMIESSAPPDGFQVWEPDGRLNAFPAGDIVSVGGNRGFFTPLTFTNTDVTVYDLSSGTVEMTISDPSVRYIISLSASPDGLLLAYAYGLNDGSSGVRVYDISASQVVYNRVSQGSSGFFSWSSDSTTLIHDDQELTFISGGSFLYLVKAESSSWGSPTQSPELLSESGLVVNDIESVSQQTPRISSSGDVFAFYRASDGGGSSASVANILIKLSPTMAVTHSKQLDAGVYAQGLLANDVRSEVAVIHGGSGASFFSYADLTAVGTPTSISGVAYKGVRSSLDGTEFTLQTSSVQPYNRRFSLTDYSVLTASPATENYKSVFYATDYQVFLKSNGDYDIVDSTTNTLITQTNPSVTTGDIYIYSDQVYKALTDNNDRPDIGITLDPPSWQDQGPINRLRMFDGKLDTLTTAPDQLVVDITPNAIVNSIALFNVNASTVSIVMTDPTDGIVYDSGEISTRDSSQITGWYQFFFGVRGMKSDFARLDLPPYRDATITLTLNGEGSDVSIGEVVLGRYQTIGIAQYGTSVGIIDFSRKETDIFGNFEILERRFSKRAEYDIKIPTAQNGYVQTELAKLRVTPLVWIGDETKEETVIYGYYRNFEILLEGPSLSDGTITVEGL